MTTELIPSIPNELFKIYSTRFKRRGLPLGIGQDEIGRVGVDRVAGQLAVNLGSPSLGVVQPLQDVNAAPFGHNDSISRGVERPRSLGRIFVRRQCPLALEAGKNAKRV